MFEEKVEESTISCFFNASVLKVLIGMPGLTEQKCVLAQRGQKISFHCYFNTSWGKIAATELSGSLGG